MDGKKIIGFLNGKINSVASGIKDIKLNNTQTGLIFLTNDDKEVEVIIDNLHNHDNKILLDKLSIINGALYYDGKSVSNDDIDLSDYATQKYVNNKIALIPSNDLTEYEKTVDTNNKLANKSDINHTHTLSNITDLSAELDNYYLKNQTLSKEEINILINSISKGMQYKESVSSVSELPSINNEKGDTRKTENNNHINVWDGSQWIDLGNQSVGNIASQTLDGLMSKEDKIKLNSLSVENLVSLTKFNEELNKKSNVIHNHDEIYVKKESGKSLIEDLKIQQLDAFLNTDIPTKTSELTNDNNFITKSQIKAGKNITLDMTEGNITINSSGDGSGVGCNIDDSSENSTVTTFSNKGTMDKINQNKSEILKTISDGYLDKANYKGSVDGVVKMADKSKEIDIEGQLTGHCQYYGVGNGGDSENTTLKLRSFPVGTTTNRIDTLNFNLLTKDVTQSIPFTRIIEDINCFVQAFKKEEDELNVTDIFEDYTNELISNHSENIVCDSINGLSVTNVFTYYTVANSDGRYESGIIDKNKFIEIIEMEMK